MSVPSQQQAAALLLELEPVPWLVGHSVAVAEVAAFLAERCAERGVQIDPLVVEAAALLHDLDKALPREHHLLALGHGAAGAAWLSERGHDELAPAVAGHTATLLSDEQRYPSWAASATLEERVVAYADKRARQDVVTLDERFALWYEKHPEYADGLRVGLVRARLLEQEVCAAAGIVPTEVARLAWVDEAMRAAAAR